MRNKIHFDNKLIISSARNSYLGRHEGLAVNPVSLRQHHLGSLQPVLSGEGRLVHLVGPGTQGSPLYIEDSSGELLRQQSYYEGAINSTFSYMEANLPYARKNQRGASKISQ